MSKTIQVIRNMNDANVLLGKGHKILFVSQDKNNNKYLLFHFQNSEQLQMDLEEITNIRKSKINQ
jgi:hypothetical protein